MLLYMYLGISSLKICPCDCLSFDSDNIPIDSQDICIRISLCMYVRME